MRVTGFISRFVLLIVGCLPFTGFGHVADFAEPTVGASNLNFANVSASSMTLNWINGDGAFRLVVMHAGSPVTVDPVNGTDYSMYQTLSGGHVIVYEGAGDSFVFSNTGFGPLAGGVEYYFEIFEFNGSGSTTEYLVTSTLTGSQIAQISTLEPSTGSSSLTLTNITGNSMQVLWTSGNGAARIVVARQGSPVNVLPTDGMNAALYKSLGNGNVIVYNGAGSSVNFATMGNGPLTKNTTYHFAVFEYNGTGAQTNYNVTGVLTGSAATASSAAEPTQAVTGASLTFRTDTPEQRLDISWSGGNGSNTMVIMRAGAPPDANVLPVDGVDYPQWGRLADSHWICYKGSANSFSLTSDGIGDLLPNTTYYFRFIEFNGSGTTTNFLTSATFSFSAATITSTSTEPPSSLLFTPQNGTNQTVSWTNGGGSARLVIARQGAPVTYVPYELPADGTNYTLGQHLGSGNYVVFNGSGNSFLFSNFASGILQPNTTYHFAVIEYTGSGSSSNYLTENPGDVLTGSVTTPGLPAEPASASSGLIFTSVTNSSMTLNWNNGDGERRIVVVRSSTPVTADPADRTDYSIFQSILTGQRVVYDGTGNSFTFSNDGSGPLVAGTTYHFEVFEYNGSFDLTNYQVSATLVGSQEATSGTGEPNTASSNLTFTNVQTDRMTLNWVNGGGDNRIVVYRQGAAVTALPLDGTTYSTYQSLAAGQMVIYNGPGSSVTFSNSGFGPLAAGTTYHFAIFEYNGSGSSTNYLTSSALTGSQTTLSNSTEPTTPSSNLNFTNVLDDEMTVNWTSGNGTNRLVVFRVGSPVSATPIDGVSYSNYQSISGGQFIIYSGTGSTIRFANDGSGPLTPGTTYFFAIYEFTGSGANINYLTSSFLTGSQSTVGGGGGGARFAANRDAEQLAAPFEAEIADRGFAVYPNPASSVINIDIPEGKYDIALHAISGARIFAKAEVSRNLSMDIANMPRGIYVVVLQNSTTRLLRKVIVK